jgi:hypothetical protein
MKNAKRMTMEKINERTNIVHGGDVILVDFSNYEDVHSKCIFKDKDYGEWPAIVWDVLCGHGHPKRGYKRMTDRQTYTIDKVKENLYKVKGDVVTLLEETYINMNAKCIFIDKDYGSWPAKPTKVINENQDHPKKSQLKRSKSNTNRTIKYNWETGDEVICIAGYEPKVVDYWNTNKIRFVWQISFTNEKDGYIYYVDAYLPDLNIYVEIKGYKRPKSMKKFEWFQKEHSNAELWDYDKLKELGIL